MIHCCMLNLDHVNDPEVLRQTARMLERENARLWERVQKLSRELAQLRGKDAAAAQRELDLLKELLSSRERALFGESTEKRPHPAPSVAATVEPQAQRGHGPREQPRLSLVERVHELPEDERDCPVCGGKLEPMAGQYEDADEVTIIERTPIVVRHRRQKYRCRCNACVVTASGPPKLVPGGRYSVEFAAEVAIAKYVDHLPLERQCRILHREGLDIDSQTAWDQIEALALQHLVPTYEALGKWVLASPLVNADETYWRLMAKTGSRRWWVWEVACHDAVYYAILDSRSQEAARKLLEGYRGIVMADGYGVYGALARSGPGFRLVHCWAHSRRKYVEIEANYPVECKEVLDLIGELYAVEHLMPRWDPGAPEPEQATVLTERLALREQRSRPIIDRIRAWALAQRPLPQSGLGKAIAYMLELWPGLVAFLEDGRIPLDNNAAERSLRGVVVGRKNHYGPRSERGTKVAAIYYTLFESAKLCGVEPKSYVLFAAHAAIKAPGTVTLPQALLESRN